MEFFPRIGRASNNFDYILPDFDDISLNLHFLFPDNKNIDMNQLACKRNATDIEFSFLLRIGAPMDDENERGLTPMMEAIIHENHTILKCLIKECAQVNYANSRGLTPLLVACNTGNILALYMLLSKDGVAADARTSEWNLGALHFLTASKIRQPYKVSSEDICSLASQLVERGADIDARDSEGQTALHYAMKTNDFEIFEHYLIKHGAKTSFLTGDNNTMLHELMVDCGQLTEDQEQMAEILLSKEADINAVNDKGEVPLHCAIISGRHLKVKFLLDRKADHNVWWSNRLGSMLNRDNDWSVGCDRPQICAATHHSDQLTLLNSAIKLGKVEVVKYLIQHFGTEEIERPNRIDSHDAVKTPLFYALPSVEIVQILLDAGADCKRDVVLHASSLVNLAARHDFTESLALLLAYGVNHDAIDFEGYTPLECSLRLSRESTRRSQLLVQQNLRMRTMTLDSLERLAHAENAPWLAEFSHECQKELDRMRNYYFSDDTSCSIYRIFTLRDIDSLEVDLTSRDIEWVFYEHERRNRYPIYADMLGQRFECIRERQIARAKGIYVLNVYFESIAQQHGLEDKRLPQPVLHAIIRNFSNADINWSYEHSKPL